jgi:hypothetical protein
MSKTTVKLSENSWNKCRSNCFDHSVMSVLILLPFLSVTPHETGIRKAIWLNNTEVYLSPFISTQNHTINKSTDPLGAPTHWTAPHIFLIHGEQRNDNACTMTIYGKINVFILQLCDFEGV